MSPAGHTSTTAQQGAAGVCVPGRSRSQFGCDTLGPDQGTPCLPETVFSLQSLQALQATVGQQDVLKASFTTEVQLKAALALSRAL